MLASALLLVSIVSADIADRVLTPPDDGRKWATVVCTSGTCRGPGCADEQLVQLFDTNPRLKSLKSTTQFFTFTTADTMWRERFLPSHRGSPMPTVWVQDWTGAVIYKRSGSEIPTTADQLANEIAEAFAQLPKNWANEIDAKATAADCGPLCDRPLRDRTYVPDTRRGGLLSRVFADEFTSLRHAVIILLVIVAFASFFFLPPPQV